MTENFKTWAGRAFRTILFVKKPIISADSLSQIDPMTKVWGPGGGLYQSYVQINFFRFGRARTRRFVYTENG